MSTDTISDINAAIGRSISHNEIVRVTVEDEKEALSYIDECGRIESYDHARENDGSLRVWGIRQGSDFRIRIIQPAKAE